MIDLRSDTVTRPTAAMRKAMLAADVGDDVYGEDPTINRLERTVAERLGKEAAVFAASGTQSNLMALMAHCERGDEYIVNQRGHTYLYEGGGAAVLGSIQPQPLEFKPNGTVDLDMVTRAIKPDDPHHARTRLFCLENTHNGLVMPLDFLAEARDFARTRGLAVHLDGARVFNAAVHLGVDVEAITQHADTVSICLSKGLGAPVGSVLAGPHALMRKARRWRKVLGGGMRQAGILAAAGIFALEHHVSRLKDDHAHAAMLAQGLKGFPQLKVEYPEDQTNMVFLDFPRDHAEPFVGFCRARGVLLSIDSRRCRLVTHLDVSERDIQTVLACFEAHFSGSGIATS